MRPTIFLAFFQLILIINFFYSNIFITFFVLRIFRNLTTIPSANLCFHTYLHNICFMTKNLGNVVQSNSFCGKTAVCSYFTDHQYKHMDFTACPTITAGIDHIPLLLFSRHFDCMELIMCSFGMCVVFLLAPSLNQGWTYLPLSDEHLRKRARTPRVKRFSNFYINVAPIFLCSTMYFSWRWSLIILSFFYRYMFQLASRLIQLHLPVCTLSFGKFITHMIYVVTQVSQFSIK